MPTTPTNQPTKRPTTSYAILGLLSVRSWTTYELAKQMQRSLRWFWPRAERKLYDEPKRLVTQGLATATHEHTGQRPRTVYTITDEGRIALQNWLGEPSAPRTLEFEAMLKVFFADTGSLNQLNTTLVALEQETEHRLDQLATMTEQLLSGAPEFPHRLHLSAIALRLHCEQEIAVLHWARWAQKQLPTWQAANNPGHWNVTAALAEIADRSRRVLAGQ